MLESFGAKIVSLSEFKKIRPKLGRIVATSGGFDPIHPGHISCLLEAKKLGDVLVVIVNGDNFLTVKKGKPFQDLRTRSMIVSGIREVDYVIPFEIKNDQTVIKALEAIRPDVFANGGDRTDVTTIPEWPICEKYNIEVVFGVGLNKEWSSSWFLKEWEEFRNGKTEE